MEKLQVQPSQQKIRARASAIPMTNVHAQMELKATYYLICAMVTEYLARVVRATMDINYVIFNVKNSRRVKMVQMPTFKNTTVTAKAAMRGLT